MHSPGEPILLPEDLQVAARHGQYTPARACRADAWLRAHCAVSATPCQLDATTTNGSAAADKPTNERDHQCRSHDTVSRSARAPSSRDRFSAGVVGTVAHHRSLARVRGW
jgi:hypothetical protein